MKKEFKSTQHILFKSITIGIPLLTVIGVIMSLSQTIQSGQTTPFVKILLSILILLITVILWGLSRSFQDTSYTITGEKLRYKCGVSKGEILITQIKSIKESKYPSAGSRPALDLNGLQIVYGEGYSIFISPESKNEFRKLLKDINHEIIA